MTLWLKHKTNMTKNKQSQNWTDKLSMHNILIKMYIYRANIASRGKNLQQARELSFEHWLIAS